MNDFWRMCLNWRVIAGVALVGAGVLVFAPHLAASALPVLFFAICPLSMFVMMRAMQGGREPSQPKPPVSAEEVTSGGALADLKSEVSRLHEQEDALERQIAEFERVGRPIEDDSRPSTSA